MTIGILGGVAIIIMFVFWKELKLLVFDEGFAASLGFPIRVLDILLTSLLVIAIVLGLQAVGAVLMSAMLVAPAVAARQWTNKLSLMMFLAACFGALAGVSGTIISSSASRIRPVQRLCCVQRLWWGSRSLLLRTEGFYGTGFGTNETNRV